MLPDATDEHMKRCITVTFECCVFAPSELSERINVLCWHCWVRFEKFRKHPQPADWNLLDEVVCQYVC